MKVKPDERAEHCQEFYRALIAALRHVAYRCGYALAVHGSLRRDIDLVACPWRDSCISAEGLIESLVKATEAIVGVARFRDVDKDCLPEIKPCGRKAWSIYLTYRDDDAYLDVSVMPKGSEKC